MEPLYKLDDEITNFTRIQFVGAVAGLIALLHFYSVGHYFAGVVMAIVIPGFVGLCDFFIHRSGSYCSWCLDTLDYEDAQAYKNYEKSKSAHWTTKFVVPGAMLVFLGVVAYVGYLSYGQLPFEQTTTFVKVLLYAVTPLSYALLLIGSLLGKIGWTLR